MVKILVFDTETTGLPPFQISEDKIPPIKNGNKWETYQEYTERLNEIRQASDLEKHYIENEPETLQNYKDTWAYIVQLSYIFFNTDNNETIVKDIYINIPEKFTTPEYLAQAHPITKLAIESGLQNGIERVNMDSAITQFMDYFNQSDVVTGHNVEFDMNMLLAECARTEQRDFFDHIITSRDKFYCTACKSINSVKICYTYNCKKTPPIFKMPRLNQAYFRMFGYAPKEEALHNALIDVVACLRVFYRLWFQGIHFDENYEVPVCGVGEPDIYILLKDLNPINPIVKIVNEFTPDGTNPEGVGEIGLKMCDLIDNDLLESQMTGRNIQEIRNENNANSRLGRYKRITGINYVSFPKKAGSKKRTKRRKTTKRKKSLKKNVKKTK
uniref:Exonuclease domain-containing protein n=1 Tax=viral metagenome TaxID=1070528 RepID=A0A6C0KSI4_9ZZZZ